MCTDTLMRRTVRRRINWRGTWWNGSVSAPQRLNSPAAMLATRPAALPTPTSDTTSWESR